MEYRELMETFAARHGIEGLHVLDGAAALDIDGMRVALLHDDTADSLLLLGEVGVPPPGTEERFGEILLQANYLFRGGDGAAFSQNPSTKAYALTRSIPLQLLDAESLADALQAFSNTLERWRRTLDDFRAREADGPAGSAEGGEGRRPAFSGFITA